MFKFQVAVSLLVGRSTSRVQCPVVSSLRRDSNSEPPTLAGFGRCSKELSYLLLLLLLKSKTGIIGWSFNINIAICNYCYPHKETKLTKLCYPAYYKIFVYKVFWNQFLFYSAILYSKNKEKYWPCPWEQLIVVWNMLYAPSNMIIICIHLYTFIYIFIIDTSNIKHVDPVLYLPTNH